MSIFRKIWRFILIKYLLEDPEKCDHEWVVYSTSLQDGSLEVHCNKCALLGSVPNPTKEEWSKAFDAPSNPYPWSENDRVVKGTARLI